jgi:hypothetical protein
VAAPFQRQVAVAHCQGRSFDREIQAAVRIQVVVEMLVVKAAGLVGAIVRPKQGRAGRSVLPVCPQMALSGLAGLVESEIEFRYFDAVSVAEYGWCFQAAMLQTGQVQK